MIKRFLVSYKMIFLYGISLAVFLFLLRFLEIRFMLIDHATELYVGAVALLFTGLGIWLALKLTNPKTIVVEKEVIIRTTEFIRDEQALERTGLSKRELEVLELMSEGLSNQEIASRLFVSLNTIKTHSSNVFDKLDVKRRTQAVEQGKRLGIIP